MGLKTSEQQKMDKAKDFENQIANYSSLGITKSKRGQISLLMLAIMIFSLVLGVFGVVSISDTLLGLIVYIPLTIFIYKGHRWAIIGAMIMWTLDKSYQLYLLEGESVAPIIIWWAILIMPLYEALKVENERRKRNVSRNSNIATQKTIIKKNHCSNCGKELSGSGSFCKFCGNKIN